MRLLVIAICLFLQASSPVPRETPQSTTNTPKKIQKKSSAKQQPPDAPVAINSPIQSESTKPHDKNDQSAENDHQIKVVEFPPISITRDKVDWALWIFNFALVVVGFLQWKVLRRQAEIAHNQELQMIEAGKQTKQIIAQMKDTTVRDLRAYVGVSKIKLNIFDRSLPIGTVEVQNFGKTPAYKVRHWTGICPQSWPLTEPLPPSSATSFSVATLHPNIQNVSTVTLKKHLPLGAPIGTPQLTIYVYGEVTYEDAFGNERHTKFRFFFGGSEPAFIYQDSSDGYTYGAMRPDAEGNDAD